MRPMIALLIEKLTKTIQIDNNKPQRIDTDRVIDGDRDTAPIETIMK